MQQPASREAKPAQNALLLSTPIPAKGLQGSQPKNRTSSGLLLAWESPPKPWMGAGLWTTPAHPEMLTGGHQLGS